MHGPAASQPATPSPLMAPAAGFARRRANFSLSTTSRGSVPKTSSQPKRKSPTILLTALLGVARSSHGFFILTPPFQPTRIGNSGPGQRFGALFNFGARRFVLTSSSHYRRVGLLFNHLKLVQPWVFCLDIRGKCCKAPGRLC